MALKLTGYTDTLSGACGVAHASEFEFMDVSIPQQWGWMPKEFEVRGGGCGWLTAGFINEPESKAAYELLKSKARLVYQSPVRRNANSGNRFFFAVFDCGTRRDA